MRFRSLLASNHSTATIDRHEGPGSPGPSVVLRAFALTASIAALAVTPVLAGCGSGDEDAEPPVPSGQLAEALASVGGGGEGGSLGFGWAAPSLVGEVDGAGRQLMERAVGPNAETLLQGERFLRKRYGFDPATADRLISVGGSYAFGLRLDGVDGRSLARVLVADGGKAERLGSQRLVEVGDYASVPEPLLEADVNGLGAFDAFGPDQSILAISETARSALLGEGTKLLEEPTYAAAADCLGDVAAVRMVPDKLLLSIELGVDLVAVGAGPAGEVICVLGGTSERATEVAEALRTGLAAGGRDPRTDEPLDRRIAAVDVKAGSYDDVQQVRAGLDPTEGSAPGYVFELISSGALGTLIADGEVHEP